MINKKTDNEKIIGVVGGLGPSAGVYLLSKIIEETDALNDNEHLRVYLSSDTKIPDRTKYLLSSDEKLNPKVAIENSINNLHKLNATVIGIACNTAHSNKIIESVSNSGDYEFISMIEAVRNHLLEFYGDGIKVALLATEGTYFAGVYDQVLDGFTLIKPDSNDRDIVQKTIYDIKAGVTFNASKAFGYVTKNLQKKGAEVVILGCTEIPLVIGLGDLCIPFLDSSRILARALIQKAAPWKLKPYSNPDNDLVNKDFESQINKINKEIISLLLEKNLMYKDSYKKQGLVGILLRSLDKINRAINITKNKIKINNFESLDDTIRDLIGYGFLYLNESDNNYKN